MAYLVAGHWGTQPFLAVTTGRPLAGTNFTVYESDGVSLANLYTSGTKAVSATNPRITDSYGNGEFYADPGDYFILCNGITVPVTVAETADGSDDLTVAAVAALIAGLQPLDSDLTAIAALATTAYGRGLLDETDASTNRTTLGLGGAALLEVGITAGTVAAGDAVAAQIMPAGAVSPYAGSAAPTGWLDCDGAAVSRTTYATLFAVVSTTYGVGDGATTFNVPDLKGRVPVGKEASQTRLTAAISGMTSTTLGNAGGHQDLKTHTHVQDAHSHTYSVPPSFGSYNGSPFVYGSNHYGLSSPATSSVAAVNQNSGTGNAGNIQPSIILNYIIKT